MKSLKALLTIMTTSVGIVVPYTIINKLFPLIWNFRLILPEQTIYMLISLWMMMWIILCLTILILLWKK